VDFGTGAVKVTPGHDPADYARGQRFKLPIVNIYEKDGTLNANGGPFAGLSREKARDAVVKRLDELGLLGAVEDYQHNVAVSDRSKSVIEPLVSEQWFVSMKPLAEPAIRAARSGRLKFRPERWQKVYLDWLENAQDWCISRQLWWGHQIPVWYDADGVPVASREDLQLGSKHPKTGKPIVRQDPDVLDTWASSWLWPFATIGWPDKSADLARFYPTQFLSTAREIIYLWVARMVMAGYELLDHLPEDQRCPFEVVNVHATVLDAKGRRMSKSLGNGIDPIELIDKYGADATRYSLLLLTKEGQDVKLAPDRIEQGYRFTNKLWNAARFALMNVAGKPVAAPTAANTTSSQATSSQAASTRPVSTKPAPAGAELRVEDRWILSRLERARTEASMALDEYRLNDAANLLYRFVWNDLCDWYLELVKSRLSDAADPSGPVARGTLVRVLSDTLALLHPFTPYVTEVLWQALHESTTATQPGSTPLLMNARWPDGQGLSVDEEAEREMQVLQDLVGAVRQVRNLTSLGERQPLDARIAAPRDFERGVLQRHAATVRALAHLSSCEVASRVERPAASAVAVVGGIEAVVLLGEGVDLDKLKDVLARRAEKVKGGIGGVDKKLANAAFLEKADPDVVAEERSRRAELTLELELLERNLAGF
jgi:valyl-tRNA synthetase